MITYYKRTITSKKLRKLESFSIGCWVHVTNPSKEELEELEKNFKLDIDLLEEGLDENELPRIDIEENKTYFFVKSITGNNSLGTLLLVIGKDFFLTVSEKESTLIKEIISGKRNIITTQKLKSVITILSLLNDEFEKAIINVVRSVQRRRKDTTQLHEKDMNVLLGHEEFLNNLASMYFYSNLLYGKMIKKIKFYEEDKEIIEDLIVESRQNLNLCRTSLKTISNIRNYYAIALSNKLNTTIKILTVFTILVSIPAAISGLYGMNVPLPLQENAHTFWYVVIFIALLWAAFVYFTRKKKIL